MAMTWLQHFTITAMFLPSHLWLRQHGYHEKAAVSHSTVKKTDRTCFFWKFCSTFCDAFMSYNLFLLFLSVYAMNWTQGIEHTFTKLHSLFSVIRKSIYPISCLKIFTVWFNFYNVASCQLAVTPYFGTKINWKTNSLAFWPCQMVFAVLI